MGAAKRTSLVREARQFDLLDSIVNLALEATILHYDAPA